MKSLQMIASLLIIMLLGFSATCLAGEASFYDSANGWIVRVCTVPNGSSFQVWIEVVDVANNVIKTLTISDSDNSVGSFHTDKAPYALKLTDVASTADVSLSYDTAASKTYVFFQTAGDAGNVLNLHTITIIPDGPNIIASPSAVTFIDTVTKGANASQPVTVTNNGNADLNLNTISLTGNDAFTTNGNCISNGQAITRLSANASCAVNVTFTPTAAGSVSGKLIITSDANNNKSLSVPVSGTGAAPTISVTPTTLVFPDGVNLSATVFPSASVTVTNAGTADLKLTSIGIAGGAFSQTGGTCAASGTTTLPPKASCDIAVTFKPTVGGINSGTLFIASNDQPTTVNLSGTGVGLPDLVVTNVTVNSVIDNGQRFPVTVSIANIGNSNAGPFTVRGWISLDDIPNNGGKPKDQLLFTWRVDGGLGAKQSLTNTMQNCYFLWMNIHTSYHVVVLVDADNEVLESNEDNNVGVAKNLVSVAR